MLAAPGHHHQGGRRATIVKGLDQILAEIEGGTFTFSRALEDVHMNVESRLQAS